MQHTATDPFKTEVARRTLGGNSAINLAATRQGLPVDVPVELDVPISRTFTVYDRGFDPHEIGGPPLPSCPSLRRIWPFRVESM